MVSRREFLEIAGAAALVSGLGGGFARRAAAGTLTEADLLRFDAKGQVTLLHMADTHAQLMPHYYREPSRNVGVGELKAVPPHLTGPEMLAHFGVAPGSPHAYLLSSFEFEALAESYGRVGGMDRLATLVKAIRAERGADRVLLLDGGDSLQGSYTSLMSRGLDMVRVMDALGVDAMTGHWEFTHGQARIAELFGAKGRRGLAKTRFLAGNATDTEMGEPVFEPYRILDKGGVRVAVIGQAFPHSALANPRWLIPSWSFGIRERTLRRHIAEVRARGAEVVVLLSHNGFDVDRKLAARVKGIDVILTAHTHDAMPAPLMVGRTLLIASGADGKFLSRLDLDVSGGRVAGYSYALIPVLANAIRPDPEMAALVADIRAPHAAMLAGELARSETLLYRRDTYGGTLDDVICAAMLKVRDAEVCFSPGFRWGPSLMPGQAITWEDIYNATAITYPACYRGRLEGRVLKTLLEEIADNVFNPDPYLCQGGDMVRAGGLSFSVDPGAELGQRISGLTLLRTGEPIEAWRSYAVAGWGSVQQGAEGPPIWDVVADHLKDVGTVRPVPADQVRVVRG